MPVNEQSFYPPGGSRGNIVTDPNDLPRFVSDGLIQLVVDGGTVVNNRSAAFYNALDRVGAQGEITTSGQWTQLVNITGAGFLGNVVSSHGYRDAGKTIGIQVEVDGVLWELVRTLGSTNLDSALILGAMSPPATDMNAPFPGSTRYLEDAGQSVSTGARIAPTSTLMSAGAPVLAFSQSLRVSVRNGWINTGWEGRKAGCTFVLR